MGIKDHFFHPGEPPKLLSLLWQLRGVPPSAQLGSWGETASWRAPPNLGPEPSLPALGPCPSLKQPSCPSLRAPPATGGWGPCGAESEPIPP